MKPVKYKVGHIYDELYCVNIYYMPNAGIIKLKHFVELQFNAIEPKENNRQEYGGRTVGYKNLLHGNVDYVVAMESTKFKPKELSELSHECLHVSMYILDDHGVKYDGNNSEQLTYHQAWLFRKMLECDNFKTYQIKEDGN